MVYCKRSLHVSLCVCCPLLPRTCEPQGKYKLVPSYGLCRALVCDVNASQNLTYESSEFLDHSRSRAHSVIHPQCLNMTSVITNEVNLGQLAWIMSDPKWLDKYILFTVVILLGAVVHPTSFPGLAHTRTARMFAEQLYQW